MIRSFFAPLAMKIAGSIILALALFAGVQTLRLSWAHETAAKAERDKAREVATALAQARKADGAVQTTVDAGNDAVARSNDAARKAAAESDDPLAAALDSIGGRK